MDNTLTIQAKKDAHEDDLILSRGANPRTGVISPHKLSLDDSVRQSDVQIPGQIRSTPKWRQKGDQWISTKDKTTDRALDQRGRIYARAPKGGLRVPQRLSSGHGRVSSSHLPARPRYYLAMQAQQRSPKHPLYIAGSDLSQAHTNFQHNTNGDTPPGVSPLVKQRIPPDLERRLPSCGRVADDDDLLPPPLFTRRQMLPGSSTRSSSAPTPRKHKHSLNSAEKMLPMLPRANVSVPIVSPSGQTSKPRHVPTRYPQNNTVSKQVGSNNRMHLGALNFDKELPHIPSSSKELPSAIEGAFPATKMVVGQSKPQAGPATPVSRYVSAPQSHSVPHVLADTTDRTIGIRNYMNGYSSMREGIQSHKADIPSYDNPPRQLLASSESPRVDRVGRTPITSTPTRRPAQFMTCEDALIDHAQPVAVLSEHAKQELRDHNLEGNIRSPARIGRKCSRCERGYVMFEPNELSRPEEQTRDPSRLGSDLCKTNRSQKANKCQVPSTYEMYSESMVSKVSTAISSSCAEHDDFLSDQLCVQQSPSQSLSEVVAENAEYRQTMAMARTNDHGICCKECCSTGCHNGCLGHSTPTRTSASDNQFESLSNACSGEKGAPIAATANFRDDKTRNRRMGVIVADRNNGVQQTPLHSNGLAIRKTRKPRSDIDAPSTSSSIFEREHKLERTPSKPHDDGVCKQLRESEKTNSDLIRANRKITPLTGWTKVTSKRQKLHSRNPGNDNIIRLIPESNLSEYWDLVATPVAASRMWIQNNPQITQTFWFMLHHYWKMILQVHATGQVLFEMAREYSKHGVVKLKMDTDGSDLSRDCTRSALYTVILIMTVALLVRVVRIVLLPFSVVFWILRCLSLNGRS